MTAATMNDNKDYTDDSNDSSNENKDMNDNKDYTDDSSDNERQQRLHWWQQRQQ